jgi:hypothetical protein
VMLGYSQGGGSVLSAQALAKSYGADGELVAVAGFAPQWPTRMNSFGFLDLLQSPDAYTISLGYTKPVVAVMRTYGWFANSGRDPAGGIPATKRSGITSSLESMCLVAFGGSLQSQATRVRDFIDEDLRLGLLACENSLQNPSCVGVAREYHAFLTSNHLAADPSGAKILYLQGQLDTVMPVAEEAACNVKKLRADGANVTVCSDSGASHANIVERNIKTAITWVEATLYGGALPTCSDSLPTCP